jgi:hypothetical protein
MKRKMMTPKVMKKSMPKGKWRNMPQTMGKTSKKGK